MRARTVLWLAAAAAALIATALPALLSARDADEETPEIGTITLQSGDNFIGWVGDSISVDELFESIPQIELVSAWESLSQREVSAAPGQSAAERTLSALEPGGAYVVRLGGDEAVDLSRSLQPPTGRLHLRAGENWVAWLGPDDWRIEDLAKGIGVSLLGVVLGDYAYDPASPETAADWPTVKRGDALKVTVARDVIWLQPTNVMPTLIFAGNVGSRVQKSIRRDLTDVLAYSAEHFGVQANASTLTVIAASGAKSMHSKMEELGRVWDWNSFRNFWQRTGGWYTNGWNTIYLKASSWEGSGRGKYHWGRFTLLHEYFHALQYELSDYRAHEAPNWMIEGSANWFEADLRTRNRFGYPLFRELIDALNQSSKGPSLESIESGNATWQYSFGLVAADMLVERFGVSATLDYFRALAPDRTGPNGRWTSHLTWRTAFNQAYDLTAEQFYAEFESKMAKRRGSAKRRPAGNEVRLRGTIVNSDDTPRAGIWIEAQEFENDAKAGWVRREKSDEEGEFELFVRKRADYRIEVQLADRSDCHYWWDGSDEASYSRSIGDGELISVSGGDPEPIAITVDLNKCRWKISGQLLGPDAKPLSGTNVSAANTTVTTELDGSFEIVTAVPGPYQLSVSLGGCQLYWRGDEPPGTEERAAEIEVVDGDVSGVSIQVIEDPCTRISGRLLDANGNGITASNVYADMGDGRVSRRTDSTGRFSVALTEAGEYHLYSWLGGCLLYHGHDGATGIWRERKTIDVTQHDVSGLVFQLQPDMCTLRISGTFLNADGTPRTGTWVGASGDSGRGGDWPASDGTFSFAVPAPGVYDMRVTVDGCEIYYAGDGESGAKTERRSLSLARSDITGIEFRLPADPASVCN